MLTLSIIKADVARWVSHSVVRPDMVEVARQAHQQPTPMEYTTMPALAARLTERWQPIGAAAAGPEPALTAGAGHVGP